jgi:copper chaperone NosL
MQIGIDDCENCKMTISDARFGGEIITRKGRIYKFDDIVCLRAFMKDGSIKVSEIEATYLVDYSYPHSLIPVSNCILSSSENYESPMYGNIAAFASKDSADKYNLQMQGEIVLWNKIE